MTLKRDRGSPVFRDEGHLLPLARMSPDLPLHDSLVPLHDSLDHSPVNLFYVAIVKLARKSLLGRPVLGNDDHARRPLVEPVDDSRSLIALVRLLDVVEDSLTNVPLRWPSEGWTTMSFGLSITRRYSSS